MSAFAIAEVTCNQFSLMAINKGGCQSVAVLKSGGKMALWHKKMKKSMFQQQNKSSQMSGVNNVSNQEQVIFCLLLEATGLTGNGFRKG